MKKGFTLVELVIVIVIVGILSIVAVPIYKGYVEKAKLTEAKALLSGIRTAQSIYYAEHGEYYTINSLVDYDTVLGIDARGNKYFKYFWSNMSPTVGTYEALTRENVSTSDYVVLYWNTSNSASPDARLPAFGISVDGVFTLQHS